MKKAISFCKVLFPLVLASLFFTGCNQHTNQEKITLNQRGYYEARGINYLVFSNWYNGNFSDSKMSGVEVIHHEVRTVTNGDVRLSPTPEQWDPIPVFVERKVDSANQMITAVLSYPDYDFTYKIIAEPDDKTLRIRVVIDKPLPVDLEGKAGFNMEFLPSVYYRKTFLMDEEVHWFPRYAAGDMEIAGNRSIQPLPLAKGRILSLAPDDPRNHITLESAEQDLMIYDGRNKAQNGWFVARSLIPSNETGTVVEWKLSANQIHNWERTPVISYSQVGYDPQQEKIAVIETDKNHKLRKKAKLYKILGSGELELIKEAPVELWGDYLRYTYGHFNFSDIKDEGVYKIKYAGILSGPILIKRNPYGNAWQPTLDIFMPVQMDHVHVNEAYRVWHGASHLDDARQAPVNHEHFDLFAQGPTTDTPFKPGEHIPGLNIGGWYDAGDYDIRTQSQYATVMGLVQIREHFSVLRDQTLVDQERRYVDLHVPDGKEDILQQIEHGAIALLAQHKAVGHAIPGIIVSDISQYTHLGDGMTMTDNLIYNQELNLDESDGFYSGKPDDRWAFTSRSSALNYGSAAALAATSRVLDEYHPEFSEECLRTAEWVWVEENSKDPDLFHVGNTTGGNLQFEIFRAAVELLEATGKDIYKQYILDNSGIIERGFGITAVLAVRAMPYMNEEYRAQIKQQTINYKQHIDSLEYHNPFGVRITRGGWAGNGRVLDYSITNYYLYKAFPDIMDPKDVYVGLNYLFGCHPGSSISFVSGVGIQSKEVAYGMNRADYSFISGGVVPGVLILPPDFPENKEDWPFLWGENEYVIPMGPRYIFAVKAAEELLTINHTPHN